MRSQIIVAWATDASWHNTMTPIREGTKVHIVDEPTTYGPELDIAIRLPNFLGRYLRDHS